MCLIMFDTTCEVTEAGRPWNLEDIEVKTLEIEEIMFEMMVRTRQ